MARAQTRRAPALANPLDPSRTIHAVLFDLDGTLYRQDRMRALMAIELALNAARHPAAGLRTIKILSAYRKAQESFRHHGNGVARPATQATMAAAELGVPLADVERTVGEWMFDRPLKHIEGCRAHGVCDLLALLAERNVPAGVLSDYPAAAKLRALGIDDRFSLVLCSTDAEIAAFKPNPRGLLRACEVWGFDPGQVLMVGDRPDVDGAAAAAAGMPCVIVNSRTSYSFKGLHRVFDDDRR